MFIHQNYTAANEAFITATETIAAHKRLLAKYQTELTNLVKSEAASRNKIMETQPKDLLPIVDELFNVPFLTVGSSSKTILSEMIDAAKIHHQQMFSAFAGLVSEEMERVRKNVAEEKKVFRQFLAKELKKLKEFQKSLKSKNGEIPNGVDPRRYKQIVERVQSAGIPTFTDDQIEEHFQKYLVIGPLTFDFDKMLPNASSALNLDNDMVHVTSATGVINTSRLTAVASFTGKQCRRHASSAGIQASSLLLGLL